MSKISLRTKIVGLVLGVVCILSAGSLINIKQFDDEFTELVELSVAADAIKLSEMIGAQLFERYGDVQAFAVNDAISTFNQGKMQEALDSYISLYGIYDVIAVVDKDGRLLATNSKDLAGRVVPFEKLKSFDFSSQPWFKKTLAGEFTSDKKNNYNGTYIEDFIYDPVVEAAFGEKRIGTSFSAQIKDSKGDVIGVITNRTGGRWFESKMANLHEAMGKRLTKSSHVHLFNGDGKMVAHSYFDEKTGEQKFNRDENILFNQSFNDVDPGLSNKAKSNDWAVAHYVDPEQNRRVVAGFSNFSDSNAIASLNWLVLIEADEEAAMADVTRLEYFGFSILLGSMLIGLIVSIWFGVFVSKSLTSVINVLAVNSDEVSDASQKIASGATELSESATEQAAALQETVAAVDEISAMVEKNSEAAQKSREVSQQSREAANRGREIVSNMIHAIEEIDHSNDEVSRQMDESNRQLSEITKLINDISSKTKVINEIVFQTKLLSFNASVEAARAGEYGKGFAVVAEEVGNLAQMSGNAAKEITGLLEESVQKVNTIVSDTKTRVDRLMQSSKEKVNNGSRTAQDCTVALDEILSQVQTVDSLVSEIAIASQEQSTGIREVSKAIGQMEQVTQQNTAVSQTSSVSAEQLRAQSEGLNSIVKDLVALVNGAGEGPQEARAWVKPAAKSEHSQKTASKSFESKVLKFTGKEKPTSVSSKLAAAKASPAASAVGSDFVPSGDDPGFSE